LKISPEWLTQRAEDAPTCYDRNVAPMAALRTRMAWQKLKRQAGAGDELWAFAGSSGARGEPAGYALVREGRIVEYVVVPQD
jgi:hypothetical protein